MLIVILVTGSLLFPTTYIWSQLLPLYGNLFFWSPPKVLYFVGRCNVLIFCLFISRDVYVDEASMSSGSKAGEHIA